MVLSHRYNVSHVIWWQNPSLFLLIPIEASAILEEKMFAFKMKLFWTALQLTTDSEWWISFAGDESTAHINVWLCFRVLFKGITISVIAMEKHALIAYEIAMAKKHISPVMTRFDTEPWKIQIKIAYLKNFYNEKNVYKFHFLFSQ